MNKVVKRIRISQEINEFMNKNNIRKQAFIEKAIIEKLIKDFKFKEKTPF